MVDLPWYGTFTVIHYCAPLLKRASSDSLLLYLS